MKYNFLNHIILAGIPIVMQVLSHTVGKKLCERDKPGIVVHPFPILKLRKV
jgi:hypothetical protein